MRPTALAPQAPSSPRTGAASTAAGAGAPADPETPWASPARSHCSKRFDLVRARGSRTTRTATPQRRRSEQYRQTGRTPRRATRHERRRLPRATCATTRPAPRSELHHRLSSRRRGAADLFGRPTSLTRGSVSRPCRPAPGATVPRPPSGPKHRSSTRRVRHWRLAPTTAPSQTSTERVYRAHAPLSAPAGPWMKPIAYVQQARRPRGRLKIPYYCAFRPALGQTAQIPTKARVRHSFPACTPERIPIFTRYPQSGSPGTPASHPAWGPRWAPTRRGPPRAACPWPGQD